MLLEYAMDSMSLWCCGGVWSGGFIELLDFNVTCDVVDNLQRTIRVTFSLFQKLLDSLSFLLIK